MALTGRNDIFTKQAAGLNAYVPFSTDTGTGTQTSAASMGFQLPTLKFNTFGTTQPGTLVPIEIPTGFTGALRLRNLMVGTTNASGTSGHSLSLVRIYQIGTVSLTATGNQFTHSSATFPLTRSQFGASSAISMTPITYVTTATATTAPVMTMSYTNQDGSSITGTLAMTFPAAATAVDTVLVPMVERAGDCGIQDISAVTLTTASAAGAATIFGMEFLAQATSQGTGAVAYFDAVFGGLSMADLAPAAPTSGTVTSYLAVMVQGTNTSNQRGVLTATLDN